MHLETDIKYDFCDVLIKPQRSTLESRKDVDLIRKFTFLNSKATWTGFPIIGANMDSTGTIPMAKAFAKHRALVALHKYYSVDSLIEYFRENGCKNAFYTIGTKDEDLISLCEVAKTEVFDNDPLMLCVDVANGYTKHFVDKCRKIRELFSTAIIMAGNVCTSEQTQELLISGGVDIVKIGIGPGCFTAGTKITTKNGHKNIEKVEIGDEVLTHTGKYQKVVNTLNRIEKDKLIWINDIRCTEKHEFYVLHKKYIDVKNIKKHAEWIEAKELMSKDYSLLMFDLENQIEIVEKFSIAEINLQKSEYALEVEVYDLEVEVDHSYVANDAIVHNSVCKTRIQTGVGYPQFSAVVSAASVAHGLRGHVCSDGGCVNYGDVAKAIGAGADFVMLGGMLSGHEQCEGEWEFESLLIRDENNGVAIASTNQGDIKWVKKNLKFYGMSSKEAMEKYSDGVADYKTEEGKCVKVPYKGCVEETLKGIAGGLRSACTYVGADKLKDFSKCCTFILVNRTHNQVYGN